MSTVKRENTNKPMLDPHEYSGRKTWQLNELEAFTAYVDDYFTSCYRYDDDTGERKTISHPNTIGLALHLGLSPNGLMREYPARGAEWAKVIGDAKNRMEEHNIQQLYRNTQVAGVIFNLKNNYGWKEKTELDIDHKGTISLSSLIKSAEDAEHLLARATDVTPLELDDGNPIDTEE